MTLMVRHRKLRQALTISRDWIADQARQGNGEAQALAQGADIALAYDLVEDQKTEPDSEQSIELCTDCRHRRTLQRLPVGIPWSLDVVELLGVPEYFCAKIPSSVHGGRLLCDAIRCPGIGCHEWEEKARGD